MARPAEFDRVEVLDKAMTMFWRTGFNATSIADLVNATQLKPGSLYSAFKSKRGLFIEVIDTYATRRIDNAKSIVSHSNDPLNAIFDFFNHLRVDIDNDEIGRGCLMVNTMLELATEDDEIRIRVSEYLYQVEQQFIEALHLAKKQNSLEDSADPEQIARFLMTNIWGLRVLSSTRPEAESINKTIDFLLSSLPIKKAS